MNTAKLFTLSLCLGTLSSCTTIDGPYTQTTVYQPYSYTNTSYYQQGYNDNLNNGYYTPKKEVVVPESYHVNAYQSPVSHKEVDRTWVDQQNPQGYTIEVANGEKAAEVAKTLYKAPKTDRRAEIQYSQDGKTYYKGVYGSYNSYGEAQKAMNNLPADLRQNAGIKNWGSVQKKE